MKSNLIYFVIPFAMACSEHQKTKGAKTSAVVPEEPTRILGVVNFDEKCTIDKNVTPCIKVKGGGDLNDTKTFVLNSPSNGFEILDAKSSPKTFRIWTKSKEKPIEVFENEHVSILAEMNPRLSDSEDLQIGAVHSVAKLDK